MKRKDFVYTLAALILALLSVWAVTSQTKNYSLSSLVTFIEESDPVYIVLAGICMIGYIFFEGLSLLTILKGLGYKRRITQGIVYSGADIYFSAITPSASGGQPASAFFMTSDGIPTGVTTATLILNLVMYTLSIIVIGIVAVIVNPAMFWHFELFSKVLIIIGCILLSGLAVTFILMLRFEKIVKSIAVGILKFLKRIHLIRDLNTAYDKLEKNIADYKRCSEMIEGETGMLVKAFLCNLIQRFSQIAVPAMVYMASGGRLRGAVNIWVTQTFVTIGSNCVPIPGAMGVSDYLLLDGLRDVMNAEQATNMELASRGISFYSCVLISIIISAIGYLVIRRRNSVSNSNN